MAAADGRRARALEGGDHVEEPRRLPGLVPYRQRPGAVFEHVTDGDDCSVAGAIHERQRREVDDHRRFVPGDAHDDELVAGLVVELTADAHHTTAAFLRDTQAEHSARRFRVWPLLRTDEYVAAHVTLLQRGATKVRSGAGVVRGSISDPYGAPIHPTRNGTGVRRLATSAWWIVEVAFERGDRTGVEVARAWTSER